MPLCMLGKAAQVFCPYLDDDLYDFLASLPADLFLSHTFHTETIRHAYPYSAGIPFDNEVNPSPSVGISGNGYYRLFGRECLSYALTHGRSRYLRYSYVLPRLLKCALDERYGQTLFSYRCLGSQALYLLHLEHLAENPDVANLLAAREAAQPLQGRHQAFGMGLADEKPSVNNIA